MVMVGASFFISPWVGIVLAVLVAGVCIVLSVRAIGSRGMVKGLSLAAFIQYGMLILATYGFELNSSILAGSVLSLVVCGVIMFGTFAALSKD
ncbi:hypothetical protein ACFWPP_08365 [Streptomyces anulatus]|uniref:hypothetical protein n=1 Tax=Streptomyces anulatus TaxID=1892 RepID=UPI00365D0E40